MPAASSTTPIYPRQYWDIPNLSPTWFAWNKLTTRDVYLLREERDFAGQDVWFWLNHPIRHVRLVGVVVQIEPVGYGRYIMVTLDDSSGANIEVKIEVRPARKSHDIEDWPSNTMVDNVGVIITWGLPEVFVDNQILKLGAVVRAQGKIVTFRRTAAAGRASAKVTAREERQLLLESIARVQNTNEEAIHWSKAADWKRRVLSKPWVLTQEQMNAADDKMEAERKLAEKKSQHRQKWDKQRAQKTMEREARREMKRTKDEQEMNRNALKRSDVLPAPWL
ncbi:OB-fold nucleic acid binding domain-containing protein [Zymoseptoria brevis]|uniref:CST complex subunit STN1 n=1 Tax=Zymoseptoria brevis TaxID=1047168 RepID=A0A0F4GIW8_9PEZI|nr:OB-fold nucleic acid binding domain-containing protein [Zymoseptoria brevis]